MKVNLLVEFNRKKYNLNSYLQNLNYDINFYKCPSNSIQKILNYKPIYKYKSISGMFQINAKRKGRLFVNTKLMNNLTKCVAPTLISPFSYWNPFFSYQINQENVVINLHLYCSYLNHVSKKRYIFVNKRFSSFHTWIFFCRFEGFLLQLLKKVLWQIAFI